jgi:hypothetical protein
MIALVLFAGVIAGGVAVLGGFAMNYDVGDDNPALYDKMNDIAELTNEMQNETQNSQIQQSNIFVSSAQGGYTALKMTSEGLPLMSGFMQEFNSVIGAPAFLWGVITVIITILVVFAWINFSNRTDQ